MRIKSYSGARGFGYIERAGSEDLLFDVTACEHFTPRIGDEVEAIAGPGRDGRERALTVRLRSRHVPERSELLETARRLEGAVESYRDFGLLVTLGWRELCEHLLRHHERLPDELSREDVVSLLLDRWSRGGETTRLFVHSRDFHAPKAIEQLERVLAESPVKVEFVRQQGRKVTLAARALADGSEAHEFASLADLVAFYNRVLQSGGAEDRLFPLDWSGDDVVYVRLSILQAAEIRRRNLLPIRWFEVEPFL